MNSVDKIFTRKPKTLGPQKNIVLEGIAKGVENGKYTRRGGTRAANLEQAKKLLLWYTNSELREEKKTGDKKILGKAFQNRRNWLTNLTRALAKSRSRSRNTPKSSSRGESRNAELALPYIFGPNVQPKMKSRSRSEAKSRSRSKEPVAKETVTKTRKSTRKPMSLDHALPPLHKIDSKGRKQIWVITVIHTSRGAKIVKSYGVEGGKMTEGVKDITSESKTRAGRSVHEEAMKQAITAWEEKKKDGFTNRGKPASISNLVNENLNWRYF
jgi:hypothetical protein